MSVALAVTDLHKAYRMGGEPVRALDGVSLEVQAGEFVAIMGASGSGKSTLLHLVGGLDFATSGNVVVDGVDLTQLGDRERTLFRRHRLGIIFQSFNLLPTLSAVENVALPLMVDGASPRAFMEKARTLLEAVDLGHRLSHRPQALSGGEQQRVAIARALMNDPAVVLADEPTGNLDSDHAEAIWALLRKLVDEQQRTVVAGTHEPSGARHADRIIILKDGRVAGTINATDDLNAALVATRYAELVG